MKLDIFKCAKVLFDVVGRLLGLVVGRQIVHYVAIVTTDM